MVCGNRWAGTTVKVVYTCGLIAGAFVVGVVGDRYDTWIDSFKIFV